MKRFRRTPQRLAIQKFLAGNTAHPSAEEIHKALRGEFPTLSLATVYKTLETLRDRGEVVEIADDASKKRFDPVVRSHHHLICVRCRKILDIPERWRLVLSEPEKKGFKIIRSQVDFHGICPECRRRNQASKKKTLEA
jgi:Fur family peroxide stress response transcriptional regulator